ncbi:MAG TPA: M4 family metallopeptidase, partial [Kribbellaceae bacterium]
MNKFTKGGAVAVVAASVIAAGASLGANAAQKSPTDLAVRSAGRLIAAKAAALHVSAADAFSAPKVVSVPEGLQYVAYERTYKGLPVIGGDFVVVTDEAGKVLSTSVAQTETLSLGSTTARLGKDRAAQIAGVDAHYGIAVTWDYYKNVHGRNGIGDDGVGARSFVHDGAYVNASW